MLYSDYDIYDYYNPHNPHISPSAALFFLQGFADVEVNVEGERISEENAISQCSRSVSVELIDVECRAYGSILDRFERSPNVHDSQIICWQPLAAIEALIRMKTEAKNDGVDASKYETAAVTVKEQYKSLMIRTSEIAEEMKAKFEPDGYVSHSDAAIFIHLSVGLFLLSFHVEGRVTERQWEWVDDAFRVINTAQTGGISPFHEQVQNPRITLLSTTMAKSVIWSMKALRSFRQREYENALWCYRNTVVLIDEANKNIFNWVTEDELPDEWLDDTFIADMVESEFKSLPLEVKLDVFEFENAVKAFDALIEEDSRDTDWTRIADHCRFFIKTWHLLSIPIKSKHMPKEETASESWGIARGIVLNRMSNDDRIMELRRNRDYQVEDRLQLYFFPDTWDNIPSKARAALISADREYEHSHGRRQGLFEDLWLATREIIVEVLVNPYNDFLIEFRAEKKVLKNLNALAPALDKDKDLNDTVADIFYAPMFEEYLKQSFNSEDRNFIKEMEKSLGRLNSLRNDAVHASRPAYKRNDFELHIRKTYAEFLGIRCNGILPHLMLLHPKNKRDTPTRQ